MPFCYNIKDTVHPYDSPYFIPILYIFIKVKSNKGKKMAAPKLIGYSHFSFGSIVEQTEKIQFTLVY